MPDNKATSKENFVVRMEMVKSNLLS